MSRNAKAINGANEAVVAPREGRVSRNFIRADLSGTDIGVAPREGRVSRNVKCHLSSPAAPVAPREGRVSRNSSLLNSVLLVLVAPREGRVSRNHQDRAIGQCNRRRAPRGACE